MQFALPCLGPIIKGAIMVSFDHYRSELQRQLDNATKRGAKSVVVTASELRLAVDGPPASVDECFHAMNCEIADGDEVMMMSDGGTGLVVRFALPRQGSESAPK